MPKTSEAIALVVAGFGLAFAISMWKAFVLMKVWQWFAVPLGAPHIGLWHAFGLGTVAIVATYQMRAPKIDDDGDFGKVVYAAGHSFSFYAIALGFGALAHAWMP